MCWGGRSLYETTPQFLKHFGLSDLSDLPRDSELLREWGQPRAIDETVPEPPQRRRTNHHKQQISNLVIGSDRRPGADAHRLRKLIPRRTSSHDVA